MPKKDRRMSLAQIEAAMWVAARMKGITKQEVEALGMRARDRFTYEEIAIAMDITRPRARVLVLRAVDRLRKLAAANDERL